MYKLNVRQKNIFIYENDDKKEILYNTYFDRTGGHHAPKKHSNHRQQHRPIHPILSRPIRSYGSEQPKRQCDYDRGTCPAGREDLEAFSEPGYSA